MVRISKHGISLLKINAYEVRVLEHQILDPLSVDENKLINRKDQKREETK